MDGFILSLFNVRSLSPFTVSLNFVFDLPQLFLHSFLKSKI